MLMLMAKHFVYVIWKVEQGGGMNGATFSQVAKGQMPCKSFSASSKRCLNQGKRRMTGCHLKGLLCIVAKQVERGGEAKD